MLWYFSFDRCMEILLQKGSVFCTCSRASNLSAVRDFGVGSDVFEIYGITSVCEVELFPERHWWVWFLVLNTGPSVLETDIMLIGICVPWCNSTNCERQSAALLHAHEIHSNVILLVARLSPHLLTLLLAFPHLKIWWVVCDHFQLWYPLLGDNNSIL